MKIIEVKDIVDFVQTGEVLAIPTNGIVKSDGNLVMGAGFAKQINDLTNKQCSKILGSYVNKYGNRCFNVGVYTHLNKQYTLASFPTKHDYRNDSDLTLVEKSANELLLMANKFGWNRVYIPFPGIGCGKLDEGSVLQAVRCLDDRFVLVKKKSKTNGVTKGNLTICNIKYLDKINVGTFSEKYFAVRSAKKDLVSSLANLGIKQTQALSPSKELFDSFLKWKDGIYTTEEQAKMINNDWWSLYVERFRAEMHEREDLVAALTDIEESLDNGKDVLLVCYCKDFRKCHRVLIGYHMFSKGYTVNFN